jgi:hypothetical protein
MSDTPQGSGWWQGTDGRWYPPQDAVVTGTTPPPPLGAPPPPPAAPAPATQPFLVTIGDIGVTQDAVVTPNGSGPVAGSQWIVTDRTVTTQAIPTWAIVMAVLFALACLLGLLFLLVKETRISGYVEVTVRTGDVMHMTQLPVHSADDVARYRHMVSYAQGLAQAR